MRMLEQRLRRRGRKFTTSQEPESGIWRREETGIRVVPVIVAQGTETDTRCHMKLLWS